MAVIAEDLNPLPVIAYRYWKELFKIVNVIESPLTIVNETLNSYTEMVNAFESTVSKNNAGKASNKTRDLS